LRVNKNLDFVLDKILTSGFIFSEEEYELKLKYTLFNYLLLFNIIVVILASIQRIIDAQFIQACFDFIYIALGCVTFFLARKYKKHFIKLIYFTIVYSIPVTILTFYVDENPMLGISWFYILLMTTFFLLDYKAGTVIFVFSIIVISYIALEHHHYPMGKILLTLLPFSASLFFMYFFEKRNQRFKLKLQHEKEENFEKTLESFVKMLEERDTYTGGHSQRVANYSLLIAREMKCSEKECNLIYKASILHDIGKIATPDNVLLKPGKLTSLEYSLIQEHVSASYEILSGVPMYQELAEIIRYHHERYDGKGYPVGIAKDDIPLLSHIMIIADSFDAMTTNRIYKPRQSISEAIEEIKRCSGEQFHPDVAKVAMVALKDVVIEDMIHQLPKTNIEKERFSYFYRDQVTELYNANYLEYIFSQVGSSHNYKHINILYLHNFSAYNATYGWDEGDKFLMSFANYISKRYKETIMFRIYGNDFVMISQDNLEIDIEELLNLELLSKHKITLTHRYMDMPEKVKLRVSDLANLV